jgi:murein DD-endopeptidase MepM/ murein hydrolase activator NlpD
MKSGRSHIIWVPRNASGKIHTCIISHSILRVFAFVVFVCICSIPFLESALITLTTRITDLEQEKENLEAEVSTLEYVRRSLVRIEEKERMLQDYFGMEDYTSLEYVMGGGGEQNPELARVHFNQDNTGDKPDERIVATTIPLPAKLQTLNSDFDILNQLMVSQREAWKYTPSIVPVALKNPKISSGFGWRKNPFTNRREFHAGIDIVGPKGTRIIAPARGEVITMGYDKWLGNYVVVQHTEEIKTIYGHLHEISVNKGIQVKRGDLLGFMGNTGISTSRHLHYTVIVNDRAVDPILYILDMSG